MVRTVLIDDEAHNLENLQWKLERFCPDVEIAAVFTDPTEAIAYLRRERIDLVFLDIEMPMMTGFDVLDALGAKVPFDVVFVTAHASFGIRAIKSSALDYILKPVHNKELIDAVERYKSRASSSAEFIAAPDRPDPETGRKPARIALASKELIEFVNPADIIACEADSNYTIVYLASGGKRVISKTLREFEDMLLPLGFFRTHLSYLVNLEHVREFQRGDGGYLVMSNDKLVPVARNKRTELLALLGG